MNSASTFGVEGTRWLQSAKATAQTLLNTFGGAGVGWTKAIEGLFHDNYGYVYVGNHKFQPNS